MVSVSIDIMWLTALHTKYFKEAVPQAENG